MGAEFTIRLVSENYGLQKLSFEQVAQTPIPAALPLFASALGGLGLFGWRRRQAGSQAA
jgi:hypothetical protein